MELFVKPTIRYCESNLNSLVAQPANACSALIVSLVGILILHRKKHHQLTKLFGIIVILIGLMSFVYHASNTFVGQLMDLSSMFLLGSFLFVAALRPEKLSNQVTALILTLGTLIPLIITVLFRTIHGFNIGIPLFIFLLVPASVLEIVMAIKRQRNLCYFGMASLVFWAGWMVWLLDYKDIWCNPATMHYINGHALWHVINAIALLLLDHYYAEQPH